MNEVNNNPFYLKNGGLLYTIEDLLVELEKNCKSVDLDNFYSHVNDEKNDYANWIENVFKDKKLANKIAHLKEPKKMLDALKKEEPKVKTTKTSKMPKKPKAKSKTKQFVDEIKDCEKLVKALKLSDAKKMYNELRAKFLKSNFSKDETKEIYDELKDLYYLILNS
jgi:hypothetical protein